MGRKNIRAGRAEIAVGLDKSPFEKAARQVQDRLKAMSKSFAKIGGAMAGAGTAILAPLTAATKVFADAGDSLDKMSARTSASVEWLSAMGFAAGQSGTDIGTLEKGMTRLQSSLLDASHGSTTAIDTLADLGLTLSDLEGMSIEKQFDIVADALNGIDDPGKRAAVAMKIFGKAGQKMLPLLSAGSKGMSAMRDEAAKLGHTMTTEDATAAAQLTDAWGRLTAIARGITLQIGAAMAPAFTAIADKMKTVGVVVVDFVKNNRGLIKVIGAVGAALTIAGSVFLSLAGTATVAAFAIGSIVSIIGTLGTVAAAVFSPIGLSIAAVAGVAALLAGSIAAVAYESGLLGAVWEVLKSGAMKVLDVAKTAFGGIKDALSSGEFMLAAQIAWAGIKSAFWQGIGGVIDAADKMKVKLLTTMINFATSWVSLFGKAAQSVADVVSNPFNAISIGKSFAKTIDNLVTNVASSGGIHAWAKDQADKSQAELDRLTKQASELKSDVVVTSSTEEEEPIVPGIDQDSVDRVAELKKEIGSLQNLTFGVGAPDVAALAATGEPIPSPIVSPANSSTEPGSLDIARRGSAETLQTLARTRNRSIAPGPNVAGAGDRAVGNAVAAQRKGGNQKLEAIANKQLIAAAKTNTLLTSIATNTKPDDGESI